MIQFFIKKIYKWFKKLLFNDDNDDNDNEPINKTQNNINIISCKIRYIKEK